MSHTTASADPPAELILSTTFSISLAVLDTTATLAPSDASSIAMARPIPRLAPVTMATFSLTRFMATPLIFNLITSD
ncbi:hypothetical protein D3C80_2163760 [compost metagenome]